ncbi:MAG TPA: DUF1552 domain-containing protein [Polyangia bacterium]|jgi:hypothetical protein
MSFFLDRRPLSRRTILRAGGVGLALPLLEAMHPRRARAAGAIPKRFVTMFTPNGTIYPNWVPTGTETSFTLSPILSPLEPYRSDLVVVAGLYQQGGGGDGHQNGIGGMLTGQSLNPGPFQGGANAGSAGWANGISIDQQIAATIGRGTSLPSLELGVEVGSADDWGRMVYGGPNQPLIPEENPALAYQRLFAMQGASPDKLAALRARRKSVLDAVLGQVQSVSTRLGSGDRARLDQHATALRDIETRLDAQAMPGLSCVDPGAPALPPNLTDNDSFPAIGKLQMDILAVALACDLTRVASLQWSRSVSLVRFTWLSPGITAAHHDLSHTPDDDTASQDKLTRINTWYASQFGYLLGKLATAQETDGTRLLDASLVFWCNELGKGNTHSRQLAPYVLAGQAGGALRTGRFLSYTGDLPHNNLLVSMSQAMDVSITKFGKDEWCTGPLAGLL